MITGYRPNANLLIGTGDGRTIARETRMCVHCQFVWVYRPGSGTTRGFCLHCHGLTCQRPECAAEQRRLLAAFPDRTRSCMPFEDWNHRMREAFEKDSRFTVLPSGVVVAADGPT